jgi:hypothetical protein
VVVVLVLAALLYVLCADPEQGAVRSTEKISVETSWMGLYDALTCGYSLHHGTVTNVKMKKVKTFTDFGQSAWSEAGEVDIKISRTLYGEKEDLVHAPYHVERLGIVGADWGWSSPWENCLPRLGLKVVLLLMSRQAAERADPDWLELYGQVSRVARLDERDPFLRGSELIVRYISEKNAAKRTAMFVNLCQSDSCAARIFALDAAIASKEEGGGIRLLREFLKGARASRDNWLFQHFDQCLNKWLIEQGGIYALEPADRDLFLSWYLVELLANPDGDQNEACRLYETLKGLRSLFERMTMEQQKQLFPPEREVLLGKRLRALASCEDDQIGKPAAWILKKVGEK